MAAADIREEASSDATDLWMAFDEHAAVAMMDCRGDVTFVNERFCAISQYTQSELIGRAHPVLGSVNSSLPFIDGLWDAVASGKVWRGESQLRAKDGSFYWLSSTIVPFLGLGGVPCKFIAIHSEITEQKRIQAELAERRHLQRLIADLPWRFDVMQPDQVDTTIEETLRVVAEAWGFEFSMLLQRPKHQANATLTHAWPGGLDIAPLLHWVRGEDLRPSNEKAFSFSAMIGFTLNGAGAQSRRLASGVRFPVVVNGNIHGTLVFGVLGQEREWREDEVTELQMIAQVFGNVIGRQYAERGEAQLRAELAHAMRVATLGELAATLAHELNQPLAAILSNAQAARRFIANGTIDPGELCSILDDIVRDGKRGGRVLHNLRAMVSKGPVSRQVCCLNELVREVADLMHAELVSKNIALRLKLAPDLPQVEGAQVELQQVMMNLLVNSVQAMKELPLEDRVLEIETIADATMAILRICDHGRGVPSDCLPKIFEPFFTTKSNGLGMGLSICRRIVENHGGRIEAENAETGGARFTVWLPVASQPV